MRLPWQRQAAPEDPDPPQGVVLHYRGQDISCSVLREPDADEHGCAAWIAVPDEAVDVRFGAPLTLTATVLPARTLLMLCGAGLEADEETWPGSR